MAEQVAVSHEEALCNILAHPLIVNILQYVVFLRLEFRISVEVLFPD